MTILVPVGLKSPRASSSSSVRFTRIEVSETSPFVTMVRMGLPKRSGGTLTPTAKSAARCAASKSVSPSATRVHGISQNVSVGFFHEHNLVVFVPKHYERNLLEIVLCASHESLLSVFPPGIVAYFSKFEKKSRSLLLRASVNSLSPTTLGEDPHFGSNSAT